MQPHRILPSAAQAPQGHASDTLLHTEPRVDTVAIGPGPVSGPNPLAPAPQAPGQPSSVASVSRAMGEIPSGYILSESGPTRARPSAPTLENPLDYPEPHDIDVTKRDLSAADEPVLYWEADPRRPENIPDVFMRGVENADDLLQQLGWYNIRLCLETGRLSYIDPHKKPLEARCSLVFARHGETSGNANPRIFQGQVDLDQNQLTAKGQTQAGELAAKLLSGEYEDYVPDVIFSSQFRRALHTADPYAAARGLGIRVTNLVNEQDFGAWDNRRVAAFHPQHRCHLFYQQQNALVKAEGGENFAEVVLRAIRFIEYLNEHHAGQKVVVICHSMIMKAAMIAVGKGQVHPDGYLGFDGSDFIVPNATPFRLA